MAKGRIEHGSEGSPEIVTEVASGSNNEWEVRNASGNVIHRWNQDQSQEAIGHFDLTDTNRQTLSGNLTLSASDSQIQNISPGGSARDVTLPGESNGLEFIIGNRAASANALTVKASGGTTIDTISQDEVGRFISDGTGWIGWSSSGGVS